MSKTATTEARVAGSCGETPQSWLAMTPREAEADHEPDAQAQDDEPGAHADHELEHVGPACPQRHPDADLVGLPGRGVGDHAVDADGDEHQTDAGEDRPSSGTRSGDRRRRRS